MTTRRSRRLLQACAAATIALLAVGCAVQADAPQPDEDTSNGAPSAGISEDLEAQLNTAASALVEERLIPSAVIMLTENDETIWEAEFHSTAAAESLTTNGEEPDLAGLDARFAYRSITKSMIGTAMLMLADDGEIALDDAVSEYLDDIPNGENITLEHLATMRSGLPNYTATDGFRDQFLADPLTDWQTEELLELAFAQPQEFEAGEEYQYSNTNTLLLGEVIEEVTGDPWHEFVRSHITEPLGLDSVAYPASGQPQEPAALPHLIEGTDVQVYPPVPYSAFGAAGGLVGTASDLVKWADELAAGTLLAPETQAYRLSTFQPTTDDPASPGYAGYGFGIGEYAGLVGHTGSGLGFQSLAMHDPGTGRSIAVLVNGTGADQEVPAHLLVLLVSVLSEG